MHIDPPAQKHSQSRDSSDSSQTTSFNQYNRKELAKRHSWWTDPLEEAPAPKLSYFAELSLAKDFNDFKLRAFRALNQLGFYEFSFLHINKHADADSLVLKTLPKAMLQGWLDDGLRFHRATGPFSDQAKPGLFQERVGDFMNPAAAAFNEIQPITDNYKISKSKGFYDFCNLPADSFDESGKVILQLMHRGDDPTAFRERIKESITSLHLILTAIDMIVIQRFAVDVGLKCHPSKDVYKLNPAPLRVLHNLANNDLNIQCLAHKLCISVVTANKHLETVRKILGVRTNYAAIKKALIVGLITLEE